MLVETGSSEDETTLPPSPPVLVETGREALDEVFVTFPPLPVEEGTAGEIEETAGKEADELRTSEETPLEEGGTAEEETASPPSATVICGGDTLASS